MTRDEDQRDVRSAPDKLVLQVQAAHPRHTDVRDETMATARSWYYWWVGAPRSAAEVSLIEPDPQNPKHARLIRSLVLALDAGGLDTRATRVGIVVSPEINAATLGKDTFILSEGVADLPDRAIDAIMAHEVGHALKEHPKKAGRVGGITQLVARLVAFFFGASREGIEEYGKLAERVVLPQYSMRAR